MKPYFITCKEAMEARLLLQVSCEAVGSWARGTTGLWGTRHSGDGHGDDRHRGDKHGGDGLSACSCRTGSTLWRTTRCTRCRT